MKTLRSISAVALATLVVVSSSSFSVDLHLCQGSVKNITLLGKAGSCEKELNNPPCHRQQTSSCCDDQSILHEGDSFFGQVSKTELPSLLVGVLPAQPVIIATVAASAPCQNPLSYSIPWRADDLIIKHRVFLI